MLFHQLRVVRGEYFEALGDAPTERQTIFVIEDNGQ